MKLKGGPGRGQGRKPGSIRPEARIALAKSFYLRVDELIKQGSLKPKETAAIEAYERDHPDGKRDMQKYLDTHRQLRRRALSEEQALIDQMLERDCLERRARHHRKR